MTFLTTSKHNAFPKKQQGAALFVSLVFLLILAVLGVNSMNDTIMQGKMASAIQDGNVALQGAETALRAAEQEIEGLITDNIFDATGPYFENGSAPDPFANATWTDDDSSIAAGAVAGQSAQPRYFIEQVGTYIDPASTGQVSSIENAYNGAQTSSDIKLFRIVARGTGGTGTSQRIIEAYYGRRL